MAAFARFQAQRNRWIQIVLDRRTSAVDSLHVTRLAAKSDFTLCLGPQQFVPKQVDISVGNCRRQIDAAAEEVRILIQNHAEQTERGRLGDRGRLRIASDRLRAARDRIDPQFRACQNRFERLSKMKQGVGSEYGVVIELEVEVPKINDSFQGEVAGVALKKLLPVFRHARANREGLAIRRGKSGSAPNDLATRAGGAEPRG